MKEVEKIWVKAKLIGFDGVRDNVLSLTGNLVKSVILRLKLPRGFAGQNFRRKSSGAVKKRPGADTEN